MAIHLPALSSVVEHFPVLQAADEVTEVSGKLRVVRLLTDTKLKTPFYLVVEQRNAFENSLKQSGMTGVERVGDGFTWSKESGCYMLQFYLDTPLV